MSISKFVVCIFALIIGLEGKSATIHVDRSIQFVRDCEILPHVEIRSLMYNFGILMDGRPIAGTNTLNAALDRLDRLQSSGQCRISSYSRTCDVTARPVIGYGLTYAYGVTADGKNLAGVNNFNSALKVIENLRERQYCTWQPGDCMIGQSVEIDYLVYRFGIEKDGVAVAGANTLKEAQSYFQQMRTLGLCY
jgi:hypothetical protein